MVLILAIIALVLAIVALFVPPYSVRLLAGALIALAVAVLLGVAEISIT